MTDRRGRWKRILVALLAGGVHGCAEPNLRPSVVPTQAAVSPVAREAPEPVGVELLYDYDRNALVDSRRVGDALIALTRAGHLLRFSLPDLAFDHERISVHPFTSLGRDGTHVLAGRADGAVFRVGASDLGLSPVAEFPGRVEWVGSYDDAGTPVYVAVVDDPDGDRDADWPRQLPVMDSRGHRWKPPHGVDVVHLDREQRLWIGTDNGEWGGHIARIDLRTGRVRDYFAACRRGTAEIWTDRLGKAIERLWEENDYESGCDGVYGFLERANGEIWAYGGTSHMGLNSGFIARLTGSSVKILGEYGEGFSATADKEPRPDRPQMPITQILERASGELLVHSYGQLFEASAVLDSWRLLREIDLRYLPGRPDAVGVYPAVRQIHLLREDPLDAVLTTLRDGLVRVGPDSATPHTLPDQLGATRVDRVEASAMGLVAVDGEAYWGIAPPWRLGQAKWIPVSFSPDDKWSRKQIFVDRSGSLIELFSLHSPPQLATFRVGERDGEKIGAQSGEDPTGAAFTTPDGRWWASDGERLLHFAEGSWTRLAAIPAQRPRKPHQRDFYFFRAIDSAAQPWLLLDRGFESRGLWKLEYDPELGDVKLERLSSLGDLEIYSGLSLGSGEILLATNRGVQRFDRGTEKLEPWSGDGEPLGTVRAIGRDGLGRIWFAGSGLWVEEKGRVRAITSVPVAEGVRVPDVIADPFDPRGVVIALGERGVARVRADAAPDSAP